MASQAKELARLDNWMIKDTTQLERSARSRRANRHFSSLTSDRDYNEQSPISTGNMRGNEKKKKDEASAEPTPAKAARRDSDKSSVVVFSDIDDEPSDDESQQLQRAYPARHVDEQEVNQQSRTREKPKRRAVKEQEEFDSDYGPPTLTKQKRGRKAHKMEYETEQSKSATLATLLDAEQAYPDSEPRISGPEDPCEEIVADRMVVPWVADLVPWASTPVRRAITNWLPQQNYVLKLQKMPALAYFSVQGEEEAVEGGGLRNEEEVFFAIRLAYKLRCVGVQEKDVVVVCLHEEQTRLVKKHDPDGILNVCTLEEAQGIAFEVVILLTTKTTEKEVGMDRLTSVVKPGGSVAGTSCQNLLKMPSAKSAFYVVGSTELLWSIPLWKDVIRHAVATNAYYSDEKANEYFAI